MYKVKYEMEGGGEREGERETVVKVHVHRHVNATTVLGNSYTQNLGTKYQINNGCELSDSKSFVI